MGDDPHEQGRQSDHKINEGNSRRSTGKCRNQVRQSKSRRKNHRRKSTAPGPAIGGNGQSDKADRNAGYLRDNDLPRLIAMWPHELIMRTAGDHLRLLQKLRAALRAERQRGIAGHWTYDVTRHMNLLTAYRAEVALYDKNRSKQ